MSEDIKGIKVRTIEQQAIDNLKAIINSKNKIIEIEPPLEDTAQILLDYITNLQIIEQQYSAILSENAELENKITNLQEENERLKELNICVGCNDNPDYKSRIDKAVEYIKERYDYILKCDFLDHDEQADKRQITYLLNILKGE